MLYELRNIKKIQENRAILDIHSLDIDSGKVYTLIGPNGAGKTTLLNILSFLDMPSQGVLTFKGKNVKYNLRNLQKYRLEVVLVDQYPILFTGPVWKNIEYGLKIRKIGKPIRQKIVEEVLEMVGMTAFINADASKLSGGETKRIALARALAIDPDVLLCDEPTANVDAENQEIILSALMRCNSEKKVSLIFATHYLSQAQRLSNSTIILQNGRLSSTKRDNIFAVNRAEQNGNGMIWRVGMDQTLVTHQEEKISSKYKNVYIDPSKISFVQLEDVEDTSENLWQGKVIKAERINKSIKITVDCGLHLSVLASVDDYEKYPLRIGEQATCRIPADSAVFLE